MEFQQDLFQENSDIEILKRELEVIKASVEKSRRSQFAKIGELEKECNRQKEEIAFLKNYYWRSENKEVMQPRLEVVHF